MKSISFVFLFNIFPLYAPSSLMEAKKEKWSPSDTYTTGNTSMPVAKEKTYCSSSVKTKYKTLINKDKIRITSLYQQYKEVFTGVIKREKFIQTTLMKNLYAALKQIT